MPKRKPIDFYIDDNGCFVCTSHAGNKLTGHITAKRNGKCKQLVRHLYEETVGPVEEHLVTRHICDNAKCINVDHIEFGTQADNERDKKERGRAYRAFGEKNGQSYFTENQIREIKHLMVDGVKNIDIARKYNAPPRTISSIRNKETWGHVTI